MEQNNNLVLVFNDSSESESDLELDNIEFTDDSEEEVSDGEDVSDFEDDEELFEEFQNIFRIFELDPEVNTLNYNEKCLLVSLINNIAFLDVSQYDNFKQTILLFRTNTHPSINYHMIRKIINKDVIDCSKIKSTIENLMIERYIPNLISEKECRKIIEDKSNNEIKYFNKIIKTETPRCNYNSGLLSLSDEVIESILLFSLPSSDLDLPSFYNIRLTCKTFHRIMYSKYFTKQIIESLELKSSFEMKFKNLEKLPLNLYKNVIYGFIFTIFKSYLVKMVGSHIIKLFGGFNGYLSLPFIDGFNDKCIDNLCGGDCGLKYHYIHQYINSPVSRGIDTKGRMFLLFIYKTAKNDIFYEFIYNNEIPRQQNVTFSGNHLSTFIGNKSMDYNDYTSASYRTLKYSSYEYIERLLKGEAGEVHFDNSLSYPIEDRSKPVTLFYEKKAYLKFVKQNYINSLSSIHD